MPFQVTQLFSKASHMSMSLLNVSSPSSTLPLYCSGAHRQRNIPSHQHSDASTAAHGICRRGHTHTPPCPTRQGPFGTAHHGSAHVPPVSHTLLRSPLARPLTVSSSLPSFFVRNASNIIRFWSTVESGLLPPPFVPQSHSTVDLRYFDPQLSQVDIGKDSDSPAECDPSAFWPDFDWSHSRQHDTSV